MGVDVAKLLKACGWHDKELQPNRIQESVRQFQRGFAFGLLAVDGDPGALTISAMEYSAERKGACSPNFRFAEFASYYSEIKLHRDLVLGLEALREITGPLEIVGAYRDPRRNREVGGASQSVHLSGGAADIRPIVSVEQVVALGVFSGIGAELANDMVRHVDVRGADRSVPSRGGSPDNPTFWGYKPNGAHVNEINPKWRGYKAGPGLPALLTWKGDPAKAQKKPSPPPLAPQPKPEPTKQDTPRPSIGREVAELGQRVSQAEKAVASVSADLSGIKNDLNSLL